MKRNNLSSVLHVRRKDKVPTLAKLAFSSVSSPVAKHLLESLETGNLKELVSLSINPSTYNDAWRFREDYFLVESFSKYPYWDLKIDREAVALEKFIAAEDQCRSTNSRLLFPRNYSWEAMSVFETARRKIERLLEPFDWNECVWHFGFGPGGTTRVKKADADSYHKFSGIPECTYNALPGSKAVLKYMDLWGDPIMHDVTIASGNRVITVPKNAKTDRVIATEPCMNIFIQKGIGGVIRKRLKQVAVDLDDQTKNQRLAFEGSVDNKLVTLDLSSASDTISIELVRALLPPDWFEAMLSCRSETGVLPDGSVLRYQKVSSMGNGFTFELESLIFWALADACRTFTEEKDRRLAIYGDDIVIPTGVYPLLARILEFAGFTVNSKKTHVDGPFRESCGKHFFRGVDVTPIYFKDRVDTYPRYIWACNQLKRWSHVSPVGLSPTFLKLWQECHNGLEGYWSKPHIPDGVGDGALIGDFDEVCPKRAPRGFQGWQVSHFVETRETYLPDGPAVLLKALWLLGKKPTAKAKFRGTIGRIAGRKIDFDVLEFFDADPNLKDGFEESLLPVPLRKRRYKVVRSLVWQWPSFGAWQL